MPSYNRKVEIPGKSSQELYDIVSQEIERLLPKASIGKMDINRDPAGKTVSVKSSMFSATLVCEDGKLSLDGNLSFLAAPFRSKIDEGIDRWLSKKFSSLA